MTDPVDTLRQRLADVERFLLIEEAADRGADLQKISRLRQHRISLQVEIDALVASRIAGAA
jgi:hypothetical protein